MLSFFPDFFLLFNPQYSSRDTFNLSCLYLTHTSIFLLPRVLISIVNFDILPQRMMKQGLNILEAVEGWYLIGKGVDPNAKLKL